MAGSPSTKVLECMLASRGDFHVCSNTKGLSPHCGHAGTTRRNSRISTAMAYDGTASHASKEMPESTLADMARRSRSESSMSTWRRRALEFDGVVSAQRGRKRNVL